MGRNTFEKELNMAVKLCKEAGALQLKRRYKHKNITIKADSSPVSTVDVLCETHIRRGLKRAFPDDGVLGEEGGQEAKESSRKWIIDPLDGTRPYLRGMPTFSVLLSLEIDLQPVVGVIYLPAMNELYCAAPGKGAWCNNKKLHVSETKKISESMGSGLGFLTKKNNPASDKLQKLLTDADYYYGFMDAYSYGSVAAGRLDFCVNLLDKPWDCSAAAAIVQESGGCFSDIAGNKTCHNGSIILSNAGLHEKLLAEMR
ncbi:inositol monophosphatase [bacterium]|nr:inositol monophosphatase [bacterium]